jgi:hypothetical protein
VASHDSEFLHLVQTVLEDVGVRVRTTMEWRKVPYLAARHRASVAIVDLAPATETTCWLSVEALRARSRTIRVLMCPLAPWLVEGHTHQLDRLQASTWSGTYDLAELLHFVGTPIASA